MQFIVDLKIKVKNFKVLNAIIFLWIILHSIFTSIKTDCLTLIQLHSKWPSIWLCSIMKYAIIHLACSFVIHEAYEKLFKYDSIQFIILNWILCDFCCCCAFCFLLRFSIIAIRKCMPFILIYIFHFCRNIVAIYENSILFF